MHENPIKGLKGYSSNAINSEVYVARLVFEVRWMLCELFIQERGWATYERTETCKKIRRNRGSQQE